MTTKNVLEFAGDTDMLTNDYRALVYLNGKLVGTLLTTEEGQFYTFYAHKTKNANIFGSRIKSYDLESDSMDGVKSEILTILGANQTKKVTKVAKAEKVTKENKMEEKTMTKETNNQQAMFTPSALQQAQFNQVKTIIEGMTRPEYNDMLQRAFNVKLQSTNPLWRVVVATLTDWTGAYTHAQLFKSGRTLNKGTKGLRLFWINSNGKLQYATYFNPNESHVLRNAFPLRSSRVNTSDIEQAIKDAGITVPTIQVKKVAKVAKNNTLKDGEHKVKVIKELVAVNGDTMTIDTELATGKFTNNAGLWTGEIVASEDKRISIAMSLSQEKFGGVDGLKREIETRYNNFVEKNFTKQGKVRKAVLKALDNKETKKVAKKNLNKLTKKELIAMINSMK